jgi:glycosyltransferase involved in cell wall biosynthesis
MLRVGIEASGMNAHTGASGLHRYLNNLVTHITAHAEENNLHLYLYFADSVHSEARAANTPLGAVLLAPTITPRIAPTARGWWRIGMGIAMQIDRLDLFHFPSPHMSTYCPKPTVVTVHDLAALSLEEDLTQKERQYLPDATDAVQRASALIAVSRSSANEVARHLGRTDVSVIPEGVNQEKFKPIAHAKEIIQERLNLKNYILCIGTIQTRKNHIRLVEAFEKIQSEIPHTLVIVGRDGSGTDALRTHLDAHPNARVRCLGYIDESILPTLYSAADALALPSLWEGFGLPVVEAMACGTPVLTSNTSSLLEIAGDAAIIVDPRNTNDIADKLHALITNQTLRENLIMAGQKHIEELSWEHTAIKTIETYQQVQ